MLFKYLGLAALCLGTISMSAEAHHSHSMYDRTELVVVEAKVKEYIWANPHVWVYVEVLDENGLPVEWILEAADPAGLTRDGWSAQSMKPDDVVIVTFSPLKDGTDGGLLGAVELGDGTYLTTRTIIGRDPLGDNPDLSDAEVFGVEQ